jgi:cytochrome P450
VDRDVNEMTACRTSLSADPPLHEEIRNVTSAPLLPRTLESIHDQIQLAAGGLMDELCARKSFDGMRDLEQTLPLTVVAELVGLTAYGRSSMLRYAATSLCPLRSIDPET